MNLPETLKYLFPDASPVFDYIVQDDGPTPVLRDGVDGRVKVPIRELTADETKEVEGVHYYYYVDFSRLEEGKDYDIVNRGPYIAAWHLDEPQPTDAELQAAWEAYQEAEANKDPELTEVDRLELALADNYEQMLTAQQDATNAQLALADLFELTLSLQAEVIALKGGAS